MRRIHGGLALALAAAAGLGLACSSNNNNSTANKAASAAPATTVAAAATSSTTATAAAAPKPASPASSPAAVATAAAAGVPEKVASKIELTGAGSTFINPLLSKWVDYYGKSVDTGVQINYQSIGSGGGIKQITEKTVDFGATDGFLNDDQLKAAPGILHIPMTLGGTAITWNLPGVSGDLKFSGDIIADIFLGKIKKWNDQRLKDVNPGINLPDADITVAHRSDGSGTTFIFTDYLSSVSPEWKQKVGMGVSVEWPVGVGGKGSEGVTGVVKQTPGSIGYVELTYATQNNLPLGQVKNKAGQFQKPTPDAVSADAAGALAVIPDDLRVSIVNADGANSYPISGFTWALVFDKLSDANKAQGMLGFMYWALHDPQAAKIAKDLSYAPVPPEVVAKADNLLKSATVNGQPALKLKAP